MTSNLSKLLQLFHHCTVRINSPKQSGHGTGFFVAPGLILTCAHVVKQAELEDVVGVCWGDRKLEAELVKKSQVKYPDIALLKLKDTAIAHPCTYLENTATPGDNLYTFGYTDEYAEGESATFECEGYSANPYLLKLKQGQVRPGLSGAPVLNQVTGKICGLMKISRGRSDDLGGRAVPIEAVYKEFPDLEDRQKNVHRQDVSWVTLLPKQVRTDDRTVQVGEHGVVVHKEAAPIYRARQEPVQLLPEPVDLFVGREQEIDRAKEALCDRKPTEFYGHPGIGKTTLTQKLAYNAELENTFPSGIVYDIARQQSVEDILQGLFDAFYESEGLYKPHRNTIRQALKDKTALIVLDDAEQTSEQLQELRNLTPNFAFLSVSNARQLIGKGCSIQVVELPLKDTTNLVKEVLGNLSQDEYDAIESIWQVLGGNPGEILQLIATTQANGQSLLEAARQLKGRSPKEVIIAHIHSLAEPSRWIVALLLALGGIGLLAESARAITGIPNVASILTQLSQYSIVEIKGNHYQIASNLIEPLQNVWDLTPHLERTFLYFVDWAIQHQDLPGIVLKETPILLKLLEWGRNAERWVEVLRLGRAIENALILGRRWGAWAQVLAWQLEAAKILGDTLAEAWALHQMGSRALCMKDAITAKATLQEALRLRERAGDRAGAAITRHNLNLLLISPPVHSTPSFPSPLKIATSLLVVGGISILLWQVINNLSDRPPSSKLPLPHNVTGELVKPDRPIELLVQPVQGEPQTQLSLVWSHENPDGLTFEVERSQDGKDFKLLKGVEENTTFLDRELAPNTTYFYRVRAVYRSQQTTLISGYSEVASGTTLPFPPAPPELNARRPEESNQLLIFWNEQNSPVTQFHIERKENDTDFAKVGEVDYPQLEYTDSNVAPETIYQYRIKAINRAGESEYSNLIESRTIAAPTALGVNRRVDNGIILTWQYNGGNADFFEIERSVNGGEFVPVEQRSNGNSSPRRYLDEDVVAESGYTYRVRALNDRFISSYSEPITVGIAPSPQPDPVPPIPEAPSNLQAEVGYGSAQEPLIKLTWTDNSDGEDGFEIYRIAENQQWDSDPIERSSANQTNFTDRDIKIGATYIYRVRSRRGDRTSEFSEPFSIDTTPIP